MARWLHLIETGLLTCKPACRSRPHISEELPAARTAEAVATVARSAEAVALDGRCAEAVQTRVAADSPLAGSVAA